MAFGSKSMPARRYAYHCRNVNRKAAELIFDQMRLAHNYQNKLVEIELKRREKVRAAATAASPDLERLEAEYAAVKEEYKSVKAQLSRERSAARDKKAGKETAKKLREISARRKVVSALTAEARALAYDTQEAIEKIAEIEAENKQICKEAYAEAVGGGLYWATAMDVQPRVKKSGMPPKFKRWNEEGSVSIQFQSKGVKGASRVPVLDKNGVQRIRNGKPMTAPTVSAPRGADTLFSNGTLLRLSWKSPTPHSGKQADRWVAVKWRICSDDNGDPVWVDIGPIKMHRDIPPDADVSWAHLYARRYGTQVRWEIQFVVAMDHWEPKPLANSGVVAVAMGWRYISGELRVGSWIGTDGRSGDIIFSESKFGRWKHTDFIQRRRAEQFNRMKLALQMMLDKPRETPLPEGFLAETSELVKWKSPGRFRRFVRWWSDNRFPGDELDFERFRGTIIPPEEPGGRPHYSRDSVLQDEHLHTWMMFEKRKARRWRKNLYRQLAAQFARRYRHVATAEINWAELGVNVPPEESGNKEDVSKTNKAIASAGQLREILESRMVSVPVDPTNITVECAECGTICESPGPGRWVNCPKCPDRVDRAHNAAKNLLKRAVAQLAAR